MKNFFFPKSIAIFGISSTPTNLAKVILENLNRFNFNLLLEHPEIMALDINPLIVFEKGNGCAAVDGKAIYVE